MCPGVADQRMNGPERPARCFRVNGLQIDVRIINTTRAFSFPTCDILFPYSGSFPRRRNVTEVVICFARLNLWFGRDDENRNVLYITCTCKHIYRAGFESSERSDLGPRLARTELLISFLIPGFLSQCCCLIPESKLERLETEGKRWRQHSPPKHFQEKNCSK